MYKKALDFAQDRHKNQQRWDGSSYIKHPQRVAEKFSDDKTKAVAVLHDVVEDGHATLKEIEDMFGLEVKNAVDALSRRPGEAYMKFIERAAKNPIAKRVKIADIEDNLSDVPKDSKSIEKAKSLKERYIPALLFLKGIERGVEGTQ